MHTSKQFDWLRRCRVKKVRTKSSPHQIPAPPAPKLTTAITEPYALKIVASSMVPTNLCLYIFLFTFTRRKLKEKKKVKTQFQREKAKECNKNGNSWGHQTSGREREQPRDRKPRSLRRRRAQQEKGSFSAQFYRFLCVFG